MSKMGIYNTSSQVLIYFLLFLITNSQADVCQLCLCSTSDVKTISIDCHNAKLVSINVVHFGLISMEYNKALRNLDLSHNNISHLPEEMFATTKYLKVLNLSNNFIQEIKGNLFNNLNNLEILNLSNNKIKNIESTFLPSLLILDVSNNNIHDLDLQFHKNYPQLTTLNLSNNNLNDTMKSTLTLLGKLQYLDLSHNNFNLLDNEDFNLLANLVSLNLEHNKIKSLSKQTFPNSLMELNVGFNSLTEFPNNIPQIKILNIKYNQITHIYNSTSELNQLKYLNISGNKLNSLSDFELPNLHTLDLSDNNFVKIPDTLNKDNYPALLTLVFNKNPLEIIEFTSHLNIKELIMSNLSNVSKINEKSFKNLNQGKDYCFNLTLTDNNLNSIDENTFNGLNLCFLNLRNNRFTYLHQKIFNSGMKARFGIDLEGNLFHCNCSLQWMLDDFVPWLYEINPDLLNNLRCATPENLKGKRMVHWYKWKEQILCKNMELFSSRMTAESLGVLSKNITLHTSNGMLVVLVTTVFILLVLVIVGIVLAKKVASRRTRINRRF